MFKPRRTKTVGIFVSVPKYIMCCGCVQLHCKAFVRLNDCSNLEVDNLIQTQKSEVPYETIWSCKFDPLQGYWATFKSPWFHDVNLEISASATIICTAKPTGYIDSETSIDWSVTLSIGSSMVTTHLATVHAATSWQWKLHCHCPVTV